MEHTGDMPTSNPHPVPACTLNNFSSICSFVWQDNRKVAQQSFLDLSENPFKACNVGKLTTRQGVSRCFNVTSLTQESQTEHWFGKSHGSFQ